MSIPIRRYQAIRPLHDFLASPALRFGFDLRLTIRPIGFPALANLAGGGPFGGLFGMGEERHWQRIETQEPFIGCMPAGTSNATTCSSCSDQAIELVGSSGATVG